MRILLYLGYQKIEFDSNNYKMVGGSEIGTIHLAEELSRFGWKVVVSGDVKDSGMIRGVEWISTDRLHQKYFDQFDVIVSVSYVHFLKEFEGYNAKKIFWAHNTHHHPWFRGVEMPDADQLIQQVDHTICLTNWHKHQWAKTYDIPLNKISVIGNGIEPTTFVGAPNKIKGRFIFSSAHERGLQELLDNWHKIKRVLPHATLEVFSPGYSPLDEEYNFENYDGVTARGTVDQSELHNAMLKAEYWCYITDYEETYCITALEMQYAKVLPIVTRVAALNETVHSGVILDRNETTWDSVVQVLATLGDELKEKSINEAYQWAKQQTWNARSYEWKTLLETL